MGVDDQVTRRAVFVDRDGVLNRAFVRDGKPYPPANLSELEILPGTADACRTLRAAGFLIIMVTNQPDVARGTQTRAAVDGINESVASQLALDDIRVCFHDDSEGCQCRKPQPGLLIEAAQKWGIHLADSFMVGDRWRDIEAGQRAGCKTVFVDYGYQERRPSDPDYSTRSLSEAADWILKS
jgi:D-glycero-D-manno-heptose 1,7-bisphosphate phosphatase